MSGSAVDAPAARVERELTQLVRRAQRVHLHGDEGPQPLERAAYTILGRLYDGGSCRLGALAESFGVTPSTVSRQVQALVSLGLVRREADPEDGRACRLELTAHGRDALTRTRALRRRMVRGLLATWSEQDVACFARLLEQFNHGLTEAVAAELAQPAVAGAGRAPRGTR